MPAIEVTDLTKRYGERRALDGVSLAVEEGECLALLGPNGAGKSTLLDILTTIRSPSDGTARVLGRDVGEFPQDVRRRVGVAFQDPITHDHLTARELVLHHARLYAVPAEQARQRADELLGFVDLADRADERLGTFSEGMKRRADLARALVTEPDVLLLDEPTAGLDPRGRRALRDRLDELAERGTTLLVATHHGRELGAIADRVAILHEGRLEALDTPSALTAEMGDTVVSARLEPGAGKEVIRERLGSLGVEDITADGRTIEVHLGAKDPSPGQVVDALEGTELGIDEVAVRAPDLHDVFFAVTGRRLDAGDEEGEP